MNIVNKLDFTGQHIYVGMDVHKKSWNVSIHSANLEHKTYSQPADPQVLGNYLRRNFPGAHYHCVYEAGFSGFWIYERLTQQGIDCLVVNPADVPTNDKERVTKSDRVDCRKLARHLRNGELKGIYILPTIKVEDRGLLRMRHNLIKKQTRCKNQIKSLLYFYGKFIPEEVVLSHWSRRYIQELENIRMERPAGDLALKTLLSELKHLRELIAHLTREIIILSRTEDYRESVHLLKTIPGISIISAMTLLTELVDISRFSSFDKLTSYTGFIPNTHGSGEKERQTGITGRRNPVLRTLLIESAWFAVRKDPAMMMAFNHLCVRMKKTRAIIHMAKKLLSRIRFVLKKRTAYQMAVV
jgi:transposase